jgi:hypothetical protein
MCYRSLKGCERTRRYCGEERANLKQTRGFSVADAAGRYFHIWHGRPSLLYLLASRPIKTDQWGSVIISVIKAYIVMRRCDVGQGQDVLRKPHLPLPGP